MRRLGLASLVLLLAACGGSSPATILPAAQRAQVRSTIVGLLRDFAAGDGKAVCARLTATGQASVIRAVGPELTNFGITSCEDVVRVTAPQLGAALRKELRDATVGGVTLSGTIATVAWSQISSPEGDLGAFFGHPKPLRLVEVDGVWRISAL